MTAAPSVVVVGAGPAGVAAARRLRTDGVAVRLVVSGGRSTYLAGTLDVALGTAPPSHFVQPVTLTGVELVPELVEELRGDGVRVAGSWHACDRVIAAPGLALERTGAGSAVAWMWDPSSAEAAAPLVRACTSGTVAVVVSSLPYRCPPAPYGLAMRLARGGQDRGEKVRVVLTTPEPRPLAMLGEQLGTFLLDACAAAGVEVRVGFAPDPEALARGEVRAEDGERVGCDLALVVPRHVASPLLADLAGGGSLVPVGQSFASAEPGLFVVGDAAATPFPRAADPAIRSGVLAAEAVLASLGMESATQAAPPGAECFVGHGGGAYSRIRLDYPDGPPPDGHPRVGIDAKSTELADAFEDALRAWRVVRSELLPPGTSGS